MHSIPLPRPEAQEPLDCVSPAQDQTLREEYRQLRQRFEQEQQLRLFFQDKASRYEKQLHFYEQLDRLSNKIISRSQAATIRATTRSIADRQPREDGTYALEIWRIALLSGQAKSTVGSHIAYCAEKLGLFERREKKVEDKSLPEGMRTEISIIPNWSLLFTPKRYRVEASRNQGGDRKSCKFCGGTHIRKKTLHICLDCGAVLKETITDYHTDPPDGGSDPSSSPMANQLPPKEAVQALPPDQVDPANHVDFSPTGDKPPKEDENTGGGGSGCACGLVADNLITTTPVFFADQVDTENQNQEEGGEQEQGRTKENQRDGAEEERSPAVLRNDDGNTDGRHNRQRTATLFAHEPMSSSKEKPIFPLSIPQTAEFLREQTITTRNGFTTDEEYMESLSRLRTGVDNAALVQRLKEQGTLAELQAHPHWIIWQRRGEQKVPYHPSQHYQASSRKPQSWGTVQEALTTLQTDNRYDGVGFMLDHTRLPLTFIDLDHCFDRARGIITNPKAEEIVRELRSYTEVSPSGEGLHILTYGHLPGSGLKTSLVEMYDQGRYFTVTGNHLAGTPLTIEQREVLITKLYRAQKPAAAQIPVVSVLQREDHRPSLTELPKEANGDMLLKELLRGDLTRFDGDESRADFVLLMKLLYWSGDDVQLSKRLYLASPLGQREKAKEKRGPTTYVDMTIMNIRRKRRNPPRQR